MGHMIDGVWHDVPRDTKATGGKFVRPDSPIRNWVTADGSAGPTGKGGFKAESDRYHLYIAWACPWAHRTLLVRHIKGLTKHISVDVVDPITGGEGWTFARKSKHATGDTLHGKQRLYEVYAHSDPEYSGRVTVPLLWDKKQDCAVNNESSEIIRMLNSAFGAVGASGPDLLPQALQAETDEVNARVYRDVNNGVYRTGFAGTQEAYAEACTNLFATLDWLDQRLATRRYLMGTPQPTEADWRLFPTLVRFDAVYVGHFRCNIRRIMDYPHLSGYLRGLYQIPGIADLCDLEDYKVHYYGSHPHLNPTGIIPLGPKLDLLAPHGREKHK